MKRQLLRMLAVILGLLGLFYIGDYLSIRYRIPGHRDQLGAVNVQSYYAIHEKSGKTEYDYQDPQAETCVKSIFPHSGYTPCWYASRHLEKRIDI
jgi:hypothetical protein